MKRSEQDIRFQWDLTKIYPDTAAWEAAMQEAEAALAPLAAIPGTLGTSKEAFKKGLDTVYASMFKVEMPYVYAFLKKTEDGSVAENQEMAARSESLLVKFSAATAFLNPEILAIPAEKLVDAGRGAGDLPAHSRRYRPYARAYARRCAGADAGAAGRRGRHAEGRV